MIEGAFKELLQIGSNESKSKLIFPKRRNDDERVSEQEMRFLFVKQLENQDEFLYSVEAPTAQKYRFKGETEPKQCDTGKSGSVDVCLYKKTDTARPVCLIEFKSLNPNPESYSKDFLKLLCDEEGLTNYFVQVIKNSDNGTYKSIEAKYNNAVKCAKNRTSDLKIFLCNIEKRQIKAYGLINGNVEQITCKQL